MGKKSGKKQKMEGIKRNISFLKEICQKRKEG